MTRRVRIQRELSGRHSERLLDGHPIWLNKRKPPGDFPGGFIRSSSIQLVLPTSSCRVQAFWLVASESALPTHANLLSLKPKVRN
jgi:hypothetical protein